MFEALEISRDDIMSDEYGLAAKKHGGYAMSPGACFPLGPVPSTRYCSVASMRAMPGSPTPLMTVSPCLARCVRLTHAAIS